MSPGVGSDYWKEYWQRPGRREARKEYNRRYREKLKGLRGPAPVPPAGYTRLKAAGREVGYAAKWIRCLIKLGRVPGEKVGHLWYVDVGALRDYARKNCFWRSL